MPTAHADDGAALAYDDEGDGPLLVLVHGNTECRRVWEPLIEPLSRAHRVVAVDLRGHGDSERLPPYDLMTMANDLTTVVRAVGSDPPVVVGHSLGGAVASAYAAIAPARGVVNIDQALDLSGFKVLLTQAEPVLRDPATFSPTVEAIFATFYPPLPPDELARVSSCSQPEQDVLLGTWEVIFDSSTDELDAIVKSITAAIRTPYLALHGDDPGGDYAAWLRAAIPSAEFEVWEGHGHYPHLVDRERFVERLDAFERSL
jgi:pimeloyl-ACP methyl ester carboxylesterase